MANAYFCLFQKTTTCFSAGCTASKPAVCTAHTPKKGKERKIWKRQEW